MMPRPASIIEHPALSEFSFREMKWTLAEQQTHITILEDRVEQLQTRNAALERELAESKLSRSAIAEIEVGRLKEVLYYFDEFVTDVTGKPGTLAQLHERGNYEHLAEVIHQLMRGDVESVHRLCPNCGHPPCSGCGFGDIENDEAAADRRVEAMEVRL